ncbi:hypothetical protein ONZ45_g9097 [Pleurotus djamor]|nr:hypothetical protein ONZ45_g9097 [Pleurotus djamor]
MSSLDDQPSTHNTRSAIQIVWSCLFIIFTLAKAMVAHKDHALDTHATGDDAPTQPTTQSNPAGPIVGVDGEPSEMEQALIDRSSPHTSTPDVNEKAKPLTFEWTLTHSYFILMGGFAIRDPEAKGAWIPISRYNIGYQGPWPRFEEADILNLTKGEALAKTIVVLQVIWFVSQLCGRVIQHLAITELEIMTLAYAIICAMLYMLWFSKPYDVQRPIFLDDSSYHPSTPRYEPLEWDDFLVGAWLWPIHSRIVGDHEFSNHFNRTDFWELNAPNLALFISATLFGGIHLLAWNFEFPSQVELMMWRIASLCVSSIPLAFALLMGFSITVIHFLNAKDVDGLLDFLFNTRGYVGFTTQVREDGGGSSKTPYQSFMARSDPWITSTEEIGSCNRRL